MSAVPIERLAYSVSEAAQAICVSPSMIRKLIREEKLQASRIGDRILISPAALEDLLEENAH